MCELQNMTRNDTICFLFLLYLQNSDLYVDTNNVFCFLSLNIIAFYLMHLIHIIPVAASQAACANGVSANSSVSA